MRVKFFKNNEDYVVFFPDSLKIFKVNAFTKKIIEDMCSGCSNEVLSEKYRISVDVCKKIECFVENGNKYERIKNEREKAFDKLPDEEKNKIIKSKKNSLEKLTLHVTNTCNLACKYCYAGGGNYNTECGLMTFQTAKKAIDLFYHHYSSIGIMMFFGGEPLINIDLIDKVCDYIASIRKECEGDIPKYGLVTNGVLIDEHVIEVLNKHRIYVTVSMDGDTELNDKTRVFKDGNGTGEIIKKSIALLQEKTDLCVGVEVTYNANHLNNNVSVSDLIHFVYDTLKVGSVHIVPVAADEESGLALENLDSFVESIDLGFEEDRYIDYAIDLLERLTYKLKNKNICSAGINSMSVSHSGDIYPCFMLNNVQEFKMGNIDTELGEEYYKIRDALANYEYANTEECRDCFMNQFCKGCLGNNYFLTNNVFKVPEKMCEMNRKMAEKLIVNIANSKSKINNENSNIGESANVESEKTV